MNQKQTQPRRCESASRAWITPSRTRKCTREWWSAAAWSAERNSASDRRAGRLRWRRSTASAERRPRWRWPASLCRWRWRASEMASMWDRVRYFGMFLGRRCDFFCFLFRVKIRSILLKVRELEYNRVILASLAKFQPNWVNLIFFAKIFLQKVYFLINNTFG